MRPGLGIIRLRFNGYNLSLSVRHPFGISGAKIHFSRENEEPVAGNYFTGLQEC